MPPVFVSIDWDFFPTGPAPGETVLVTDSLTGEQYPLPDWMTSAAAEPNETKSDYLRDRAWNINIRACASYGVDVSTMYSIRPENGSTTPDEFFAALERRYDPNGPLVVADSHAHALGELSECVAEHGGPVRVLHFDAHHDLGYSPVRIADDKYLGRVSCESWLFRAFEDELVDELVVVYPDWLDRSEGSEANPVHLLSEEQAARVRWLPFSDWVAQRRFDGHWDAETCRIFLARSGWWSPPWLDREFIGLAERFVHADADLLRVLEDALTPRRHADLRPAADRELLAA